MRTSTVNFAWTKAKVGAPSTTRTSAMRAPATAVSMHGQWWAVHARSLVSCQARMGTVMIHARNVEASAAHTRRLGSGRTEVSDGEGSTALEELDRELPVTRPRFGVQQHKYRRLVERHDLRRPQARRSAFLTTARSEPASVCAEAVMNVTTSQCQVLSR